MWNLLLQILIAVVCFVIIIKGGDLFLDASIWMAKITKMPKVLIGATIVSVGTTLPEILVSVFSAAQGDFSLAMTNAVGSMFANVALILGLCMALTITTLQRKSFLEKIIMVLATSIAIVLFCIDGKVVLWESLVLLLLFVIYMVLNILEAIREMKMGTQSEEDMLEYQNAKKQNPWLMIGMFVLGAGCIGVGAKFLVDSITIIAVDYLKISTSIVGVTVVAVGTSLPELITCIKSVKKNSAAISFGNIMGANIINGSFLAGLCTMFGNASGGATDIIGKDILFAQTQNVFGSTIMLGSIGVLSTLLILIIPILARSKTSKWQGFSLLAIYFAYIIYLVLSIVL